MKKLFLLIAFSLLCTFSYAQLSGTRWTGNVAAPEVIPVTLNFNADVFEVLVSESNEIIETMTYKVSGDTLIVKKTSGGSPCPNGSAFKVKFAIQGDRLMITPISDDCPMRAESWTKDPFIKVKE